MKKFKSVEEMLKASALDKKTENKIIKSLKERKIANFLFSIRCDNGFTQKELAKKIGCTQSRISKIESSTDEQISIKDLSDYGEACGLQLEIGFRNKSVKLYDLMRYHFCRMAQCLSKITNLAGNDSKMIDGVTKVNVEVLQNTLAQLNKNIKMLENNKKRKKEKNSLYISQPVTNKLQELEKKEKELVGC